MKKLSFFNCLPNLLIIALTLVVMSVLTIMVSFLSHTLTTMTLLWLIICLITVVVFRNLHFPHTKPYTKHNQQEPINEC